MVKKGDGNVTTYDGLTVYANTTHIWARGGRCGVVYVSNPALPRSPYVFRGAVQGLRGERLNIFADMAIDSCTGTVYLSDGGKFYPVGNVAKLSFVGAQPDGMLWPCRRYSPS